MSETVLLYILDSTICQLALPLDILEFNNKPIERDEANPQCQAYSLRTSYLFLGLYKLAFCVSRLTTQKELAVEATLRNALLPLTVCSDCLKEKEQTKNTPLWFHGLEAANIDERRQ